MLACRKALEFAIDVGFTEIILEGDNAMVMKTISQAQPDLTTWFNIRRHLVLSCGFQLHFN